MEYNSVRIDFAEENKDPLNAATLQFENNERFSTLGIRKGFFGAQLKNALVPQLLSCIVSVGELRYEQIATRSKAGSY